MIPVPKDNFNGMTIARSSKVGAVYSQVAAGNTYTEDAEGDRTSIALIAPGDGVEVGGFGGTETTINGTSFATPHVTGTVALLQQYTDERIMNAGAPRWTPGLDASARRHEVMKAVLMNSADKLIDNGTLPVGNPAPQGGLLGMDRTIIDQQGMNWLQSEAYNDGVGEGGGFTPLDDQMGAGHLNATRALQQFNPGEYGPDSGDVPVIGWDYGNTTAENDINRYPLAGTLTANHFISITLAWDRQVTLAVDGGTMNQYDAGDMFQESMSMFPEPDSDDLINNLDIFLLPKGSATVANAVAESFSAEGTVQHIFFQIPTTDEYEIWVRQIDDGGVASPFQYTYDPRYGMIRL